MKTSEEINQLLKELDAPIPRSAVSTREGGGGKKLNYLTGFYVIDRLNKTLGQGNWSYEIKDLRLVREGTIKRYDTEVFSCNYVCSLTLYGAVGHTNFSFNDVGYGDGTDKVDPGKAHELAVKEAVTDALKRCARNLGMSLGLALYDKTQENVQDDRPPRTSFRIVNYIHDEPPQVVNVEQQPQGIKSPIVATASLALAIKAGVQVLIAKQKITAKGFREKYGLASKVDDLPTEALHSLYDKVKNDFPELELN